MRKFFKYCLLFAAILGGAEVYAQNNNIDSLFKLLKADKEDTNKVIHLNGLGWELKSGDPDSSIIVYKEALSLATVLADNSKSKAEKDLIQKHVANVLNNIGFSIYIKGDYPNALDYYLRALKIFEELKNKRGMAKCFSNLGIVYYAQHDFNKSLFYYSKGLKTAEEIGNKQIQLNNLSNIGLLYADNKNYEMAIEFYSKALSLAEELGNKEVQATNFGNIGILYFEQAKKIEEQAESRELMNKALANYFKALKAAEEIGFKLLQANTLGNIGSLYIQTKQYPEAEKYLNEALKINKEMGALNEQMQTEELLTALYNRTDRFELALKHYKDQMALKDTLFNVEKNKELTRKEMNYEFDKKEAMAKAEQQKKDAVTRIVIISISGGFILVLLLSGFIFRGYREKKRANELISEQKKMVEMKQKEILDSIHYAKRIQQSLLPTEVYIERNLGRLKKK